MTSVLTRIIQAVSPKAPKNAGDLLDSVQREVWPFLQQVRRKINEIITVIDTYPTAFDDHTALTQASRATARQHPSAAVNTDDGSTFTGHLVGTDDLREAMAVLDDLVIPTPGPAFPGFYEDAPLPDGTASPGTSAYASHGDHVHPMTDPVVAGSYLYTALVGGQAWADCATTFGGYIHPWNNGWTETALGSGVWNRDSLGSITDAGVVAGFFDGVTPELNMRLFSTYSPDAAWRMFDGIYTVTSLGSESSHAQVTRATDLNESSEFVVSKCVKVTGGTSGGGHVFRYNGPSLPDVDTDLLSWEDLGAGDLPGDASYELLTAAQLVTEGANSNVADLEWSQSFGGDTPATEAFLTIAGTPGVSSLPAGLQEFRIEQVSVTTGASSGTTTLKLKCYVVEADGGTIVGEAFTAESLPIVHNAAPAQLRFQYTLASAVPMTSAYRLVLIPILSTDVTELLTISIRYNSPTRGTWWKSTMTFATTTAAEEDFFDVTIDGDGIIDTQGHTNLLVHPGTLAELNGITTSGHRVGHTIACTFTSPIVMNDGAAVTSPVFKLYLEQPSMGTVKTGCAIFRMLDMVDETDLEGAQIQCWRYNGGSLS